MNVLAIGGAGFTGSNAVAHHLRRGDRVRIFDNLSTPATDRNLAWLRDEFGTDGFRLIRGDLRVDQALLAQAMDGADVVLHLAGQTSAHASVDRPYEDFEINTAGTLNVLEAARAQHAPPRVVYFSTSAVYGILKELELIERATRWEFSNTPYGVAETQSPDYAHPAAVSKGAAEQYVRSYARLYGLKTVVLRQSCVYGPRQFGSAENNWPGRFSIAALANQPITISGDGKQLRDVVHVDDFVRAYQMALDSIDTTSGEIYNIGGGPQNTLSPLELIQFLENFWGKKIEPSFVPGHAHDPLVYVSDIRKAQREFGWEPTVDTRKGLTQLAEWVQGHRDDFQALGLI